MFARLREARKTIPRSLAALALMALAACQPTGLGGPSVNTSAPVPVALLVPSGSGNSGDEVLARSLTQAAQLAIADLQGVQIDLRVYNTGGAAPMAADAARRAVSDGAKIILGPVYAESANAAGLAVAPSGVNVLAFSNNPAVAGGNVFVLGPTFQNTANRLAAYAARQGKSRIVVVYDQNQAGELGRRAIEAALIRSGITVAGMIGYEFSQEGVIAAVPQIVDAVRTMQADAVFLTADTAGALPYLAQMLPEAGVDPSTTTFIGLTRWDIPPGTLTLPGVQGGWFTLPDPALADQFSARYAQAYGGPPHPIAGLAYDGVAAIGALVRQGSSSALTGASLTQPAGFAGVNGVFRLLPDGTNERGLAVGQVQSNQVFVIDPAPRSFGLPGF